jgi:Ca2+-binding EF-hand superfamily protein
LADVTGGVMPLMHTLIQVLTLDSWNSIARPMMKYVPWCWAFFYLYIAIAVIVMMNLVTAVIVENALKNSQKDAAELLQEKEKEKKHKLSHFKQVFADMDVNGDGELSWEEFASSFEDKELSTELRVLGIEPESCREIFNMLDTGDGVLSVEEFFEGIGNMEGMASAKDVLRTNKTADFIVKLICQQNKELREDLDELLRLTPGATVRTRKGCLKKRARRDQVDNNVFHTNPSMGSGASSPASTVKRSNSALMSSPTSMAKRGNSFRQAEQTTLNDVMKRLEQVASMVTESRQECQEGLAVCNQKIYSMSNDLQSILPKGCAIPPEGGLYPDASGANGVAPGSSRWRSSLLSDRVAAGIVPLPVQPPSRLPPPA